MARRLMRRPDWFWWTLTGAPSPNTLSIFPIFLRWCISHPIGLNLTWALQSYGRGISVELLGLDWDWT